MDGELIGVFLAGVFRQDPRRFLLVFGPSANTFTLTFVPTDEAGERLPLTFETISAMLEEAIKKSFLDHAVDAKDEAGEWGGEFGKRGNA